MENQTIVDMLVLTGLSDVPSLQLPLFLVFLLIYLMTLSINLLTDSHLHTPIMLFDLLTQNRVISVPACITQIYFFLSFAVSEMAVLAVMSYDRYIAICRPLHYTQIMSWNVCVRLILIILLLQVSCSDTFINVLLIFLFSVLYGVGILVVTFYPYIPIITTVLKISAKHTRSKAFSTCSSHLTVVSIFYSTAFFNYFRPNANDNFNEDKVSVFYAILTPFLNPLIYSLRNQELKTSLRKTLHRHKILHG
ncbi:hypothetical protein XENTR_v10023541 [Xenopus tropicalis]|nr:hypothetical protein XENTR_v10023541 [Xenopus tropicalis]